MEWPVPPGKGGRKEGRKGKTEAVMEGGREGERYRKEGRMDGKREAECTFVDTFLNVVHSQFCDEEIQHQYFELSTLRMKLTISYSSHEEDSRKSQSAAHFSCSPRGSYLVKSATLFREYRC